MADDFAPGLAERVASVWDRGPHVFRDVLPAPIFTAREYMDGVMGTATEYLSDAQHRYGRVFVAGEVVRPDQLPPFLPRAADSIDEYLARVARAHPDHAVILSACERYIPAIRARVVPLLHGIFSRVGYPAQTNLGCIYSGTYKTSPFGIHTDPCHVLMCCGIGTKRMAFWPRAYFEPLKQHYVDNKVHVPVAEHLDGATVLEIGPRDVLYWPANTWHVGVSETADFHAALSLGLYHRASNASLFNSLDFMPKRALDVPQVEQYDTLDIHGFGPSLISKGTVSADEVRATALGVFFEHWDRAREILSKPGEADFRILQLVLLLLTSAGFGPPRASSMSVARDLASVILRCPIPEALLVAHARDGLLIGANGHVFFCAHHVAAVARAIADVRAAASMAGAGLLASAGAARDTLQTVLQDLVNTGALCAVVPDSPASDRAPGLVAADTRV